MTVNEKRKVQGAMGASGSERQTTGERTVGGMSTTPHKEGLWGSGG